MHSTCLTGWFDGSRGLGLVELEYRTDVDVSFSEYHCLVSGYSTLGPAGIEVLIEYEA